MKRLKNLVRIYRVTTLSHNKQKKLKEHVKKKLTNADLRRYARSLLNNAFRLFSNQHLVGQKKINEKNKHYSPLFYTHKDCTQRQSSMFPNINSKSPPEDFTILLENISSRRMLKEIVQRIQIRQTKLKKPRYQLRLKGIYTLPFLNSLKKIVARRKNNPFHIIALRHTYPHIFPSKRAIPHVLRTYNKLLLNNFFLPLYKNIKKVGFINLWRDRKKKRRIKPHKLLEYFQRKKIRKNDIQHFVQEYLAPKIRRKRKRYF